MKLFPQRIVTPGKKYWKAIASRKLQWKVHVENWDPEPRGRMTRTLKVDLWYCCQMGCQFLEHGMMCFHRSY
ncbi:hypothetical protein JTE90_024632 [Oedothorax gibbosus]|uniref:Uncharacterized protein n=1 Tax=Oedothorax gibbosus TaxID=931172 RepID=A0AAV6U3G9_9ARAC|nr:hypothetical protein JTE90_024632 [Oedothorax gibbosus]